MLKQILDQQRLARIWDQTYANAFTAEVFRQIQLDKDNPAPGFGDVKNMLEEKLDFIVQAAVKIADEAVEGAQRWMR